jgi:hypothetical protein
MAHSPTNTAWPCASCSCSASNSPSSGSVSTCEQQLGLGLACQHLACRHQTAARASHRLGGTTKQPLPSPPASQPLHPPTLIISASSWLCWGGCWCSGRSPSTCGSEPAGAYRRRRVGSTLAGARRGRPQQRQQRSSPLASDAPCCQLPAGRAGAAAEHKAPGQEPGAGPGP